MGWTTCTAVVIDGCAGCVAGNAEVGRRDVGVEAVMRNFGGFGAAMLEVVTFAGLPVECAGEALRLSVEDLKDEMVAHLSLSKTYRIAALNEH